MMLPNYDAKTRQGEVFRTVAPDELEEWEAELLRLGFTEKALDYDTATCLLFVRVSPNSKKLKILKQMGFCCSA